MCLAIISSWSKVEGKMAFHIGNLSNRMFSVVRTRDLINMNQDHPDERNDLGLFENLPTEIAYHILSFLTMNEIGELSLTSDKFRLFLSKWIWTAQCQNRLYSDFGKIFTPSFKLPEYLSEQTTVLKLYLSKLPTLEEFGVLCKRLSCLTHTSHRIDFGFTAFEVQTLRDGNLVFFNFSFSRSILIID